LIRPANPSKLRAMLTRREFLSTLTRASAAGVLAGLGAGACAHAARSPHYAPVGRRITHRRFTLRMKGTWSIARGSMDSKDIVIVELERDGYIGRGEAAPSSFYGESAESSTAFVQAVTPLLESADWRDIDAFEKAIVRRGAPDRGGLCAVTTALLDWNARRRGLPLHRHLGIDARTMPRSTFSIGISARGEMLRKVRAASAYPLIKIKVGFDGDIAIIEAIRSISRQTIRVDANGGWRSKEEALEKITALARLGVEFVEQPLPVDRIDDARWLTARSPLPIIADEGVRTVRDIAPLTGACHGINIKLMKCGGIPEALRMIALARSHGMRVMLGCMIESSLGITAAAHIAPLVDYADLDGNLLVANDPFVRGVRITNGLLVLPGGPGIGVE